MRQNVEERACIAKQLASNTTLSKAQQAALEHIFGSDVFVAGAASSSSSSKGNLATDIFPNPLAPLGGYVNCYVSGYV